MASDLELREKLAAFVAGEISRDDFEDWFVQNTWNIHKGDDIAAQRLAYAIELRLAENEQGHLPDEEFHNELADLLKVPLVLSNASLHPSQFASTASSITFMPQSWELMSVDIRYAEASWSPVHR